MVVPGQNSRLSTAVWALVVCLLWIFFALASTTLLTKSSVSDFTQLEANRIADDGKTNSWQLLNLRYTHEDAHSKTLQTIRDLPASEWQYLGDHNPNLGFQPRAVWFHGKLNFVGEFSGYLQIERAFLNYLSVFTVMDGTLLQEFYTGDKFEFHHRPIIHNTFLFPVTARAGDQIDLYFRVDAGAMPLSFQANLFTQQGFVHHNQLRSIIHTLYFGAVIIITLYNLFLYFSLRESSYLFYVLSAAAMGVICATYLGYSYEFLWPENPLINQFIIPALLPVFRISTAFFILNFLSLKTNLPIFYRLILIFVVIDTCVFFLRLVYTSAIIFELSFFVTLLFYPALLIATYIQAIRGENDARYVSIGWTIFTLGGLSFMRSLYGGIDYSTHNIELLLYGHLAETVLFAFALANRINIAREKLDEAGVLHEKSAANAQELLKIRAELMQSQIDKVELEQLASQARIESNAKSEFIASVSHEVRTPMHGVIGITEILRDTSLSEDQRKYVDIIHESGQNLLTIINDVLDYATIEAGKMPIDHIDFDLEELVNDCISIASLQCLQKQLQLVCCMGPGVPQTMKGDPHRLRQVLMNLLNNAIKFTETGEISLKTTFESFNLVEHAIRFQICDTGIGLSTEQQSEIFQSFKQATPTRNSSYNRTGIGLSISSQLTKLMGGKIGLQSELGKGTCVSILIPYTPASTDFMAITPLYKQDLKGRRLLIVDRLKTFREFTRLQAEAWGLITDTADSEKQALNKLYAAEQNAKPFDLVLAEMALSNPGESDLAETIHFDKQLSKKPAVVLISSSRHQRLSTIEEDAPKYYAGELLAKPVLSSVLRKRLVEALGEKQFEAQSRPSSSFDLHLNLNILVVDDNQTNRIVARGQLEKLGLKADFAENGEQAVALVETHEPYDLILMDINMPSLDGFAACQLIRAFEKQNERKPAVIVALTAHIGKEVREKSEAVGMNGFLGKPILIEALKETVLKFFGSATGNN